MTRPINIAEMKDMLRLVKNVTHFYRVLGKDALTLAGDILASEDRVLEPAMAVALGLVVASFVAAFMSTVSTQINWGASYLVNDLYARFVNPEASQKRLVALGRLASVIIVAFAAVALTAEPMPELV